MIKYPFQLNNKGVRENLCNLWFKMVRKSTIPWLTLANYG